MAEVPSGGVFGTPWQVFGTLAPAKSKWPLELFQGHLRLIAPEHYSSKINLRVRRPPFEAEDALKYVEC